jgi:hypothetical protein
MENININQTKIEEYANNFTIKACDSFFSMFKTSIIGTEIMKVTPVEQVNYFILFNLFENWKQEVAKIESPYFDYSKPDVQESLRSFMNTLSMNINIKREDFEPLLRKSVIYTLNLVALPKMFFGSFFGKLPEKMTFEQLAALEKYFKINKTIYSQLLEQLKTNGKNDVTRTYILNSFTDIVNNFSENEKEKEAILLKLNTVSPLNLDVIFGPQTTQELHLEQPTDSLPYEIKEQEITPKEEQSKDTDISDFKKENFKNNSPVQNRMVDVKSAMTINQRFMFVEQLFKGEKWEFDNAINKLELYTNYDDAIKMLLSEYAIKYDWDTENEQVSELFDFVGKKYAI